ncbi:hypothetical protein J6A31_06620 [bacterium]|nr:hypothetical protein [bacterium]
MLTTYEKIEMLKPTIEQLYCKEGRSKSYISKLLNVNRHKLTEKISEWNLKEAEPRRHLTPSNAKFLNKHKSLIVSRLNHDVSITKIAEELNVSRSYLQKTIIPNDDVLSNVRDQYVQRLKNNAISNKTDAMNKSGFDYDIIDFEDEEWKDILGYDDYMISNYGRIKHLSKRYNAYHIITPSPNKANNRLYVMLYKNNKRKNIQVAHLVAHAFVDGYSSDCNTVNHKDGNVQNNHYANLEWMSQSDNNKHAYAELKRPVINEKTYKFSSIKYKNKYEFKTISALARFIGKSETQVRRYLDEPSKHEIKLIK